MKYWAYVKNEILGPFEKEKLLALPEFSPSLLICPQTPVGEKTEDWKEASSYPEIAGLLGGAAPGPGTSSPAPAAAEPSGTREGDLELEPRASAAPPESGGLKQLHGSELSPFGERAAHEPGVDIPVVKLSGGLGQGGDTASPGSAQAEGPGTVSPSGETQVPGTEPAPADAPQPAGDEAGQPPEQTPSPATPSARNFSSSFDPISLSRIDGSNRPPEAAEEPPVSPQEAAAEEAGPAQAEEAPAAQAVPGADRAAGAFDPALIEEMIKRNLRLAASPPPDIRPHLDPLVIKIDQIGEVLSSLRNSQFQQEVLTKIRLIEDSVSELRRLIGDKPAATPEVKPTEKEAAKPAAAAGFFGMGSSAKKEEPAKQPAPEPAAGPAPAAGAAPEPADEGGKKSGSRAAGLIRTLLRGLVTVLLLAAVLGGAAFMLRNLGIFDVTPYIPFPIPGLTPGAAEAEHQPRQESEPAAGDVTGSAPQAEAEQDPGPEIIFIARTFSPKEGGEILESRVIADALRRNGDADRIEWKVGAREGEKFRTEALVPLKDGSGTLSYAFVVDRTGKSVTPDNPDGRGVMQELFGQKPAAARPAVEKPATEPPARASKKPASRARKPAKAAKKPAPKAAPKAAAPAAAPAPEPAEGTGAEGTEDSEYEYVYVEEEEAGGGDEAEYLMGMPGFGGR